MKISNSQKYLRIIKSGKLVLVAGTINGYVAEEIFRISNILKGFL